MPSRRTQWLGAVWCMIVAIMPTVAYSANRTWNGASTTDFWWSGNWVSGTAPVSDLTSDVGVFANAVTANQPSLTASGSITGLSFTTSSGGWTLGSTSSANVLTLGASGLSAANTSGTNTISANLALGATQTWSVNTGGTLRVSGGVSMGSSLAAPAAYALTIGPSITGSNGTVVFDPTAGSNVAIYYQGTPSGTASAALTIVKPTVFGAAVNSSSGTNVISHATGGGVVVSGSLTVNSGVWLTNDIGRNSAGASVGTVNINAGTLAAGGTRWMLTINGTSTGQWTVDGGTLKVAGSSVTTNAATFQLGGSVGGTPTASTVANFNLKSGLVDVAKGNSNNAVGSQAATTATPPSVLMNQSGGVAQFGVTAGSDVFTGVTNANTSNNLAIGNVGGSGTGVKAAYTLTGGRLLVAGNLQGNAPAAGSNGVSNFNFMGGALTVGTFTATSLGSSGTATATSNQVASSDNIGTLVNYGGVLAPGGDLLSFTADQYGNSSIATTAVAGKTTITGNYVVSSANAALAVNLSGATASTSFQEAANSGKFSNVEIKGTGTNTLGGNLLVKLINGTGGTTFAPTNANTFKIVTFTGAGATNSGTFAGNNVAGGKVIATDGLTAFTITYDYTAITGGVTLGSGTTNEWKAASGSDWNTAGSWTAMAPNTSAFIARFADSPAATGSNSVSLASNLTIQGIQFASTSRQYTISSSNGSGLTLDASPKNTTNLMTNAMTAATAQITDSSAGAGSHTIAVPLTLASDVAVSVSNAASTVTISGNVSGAGRALAKSGSGTLVLSGSNSYTGSTAVTAGTLSVTSPNALPGWNAAGKVTLGTGAGLTITSAFSSSDLTTLLTNVTFSGSNRLGIDTTGGNLSYSGTITDQGTGGFSLAKLGTGMLTLSGSNGYTGATTVSGGTLSVSSDANLGMAPGAATAGQLVLDGGALAVTGGFTLSANRGVALGPTSGSGGGTIDVAGGQTLTYAGAIVNNGSGTGSLSKTGAGTLALSGSSPYSGGTTLSAGQLNLNNASAIGSGTFTVGGASTIDTTNGSAVQLSTNNAQAWNADFTFVGSNPLNLGTGAVVLGASRTVTVTSSTLTVGGVISGSYALTKAGAGTLALAGTSTYSGDTTVSSGVLRIEGAGRLGSGTYAGAIANSGVLDYASSAAQTLSGAISGGGSLLKGGAGTLTLSASNGFLGGVTLNSGTIAFVNGGLGSGTVVMAANTTLLWASGNTQDVSALLTLPASGTATLDVGGNNVSFTSGFGAATAATLVKAGTGTLTLTGSNGYAGGTVVSAGTLSVTSPNALPGWNASGKVTVGTGAGLTITTAFSASDLTTLLTNATFSGSNRLGIDTTPGNLSYSTAITDKGTGGFGLIKLGSGTLTLSGSNSYTGGTVIGTTSLTTGAIVVQGNQSGATGGWAIGAANTGTNRVTFDAGSAVAVAAGREIQVGAKSTLGTTAANQTLTVSGTVTNNGSFYAGRGGQVTLQSGAVWTQSGSATLEAIGGAAVSLNVNTGASYAYTGTSTFLVIGPPTSNGVATVAIAGGTFSTARGFEQTSNLTNAGYGRVSLSSGGVLRLTDNVPVLSSGSYQLVRFELGSGGGTIDTNGFDAGLAAAISGSGGLTKAGLGTLTVSGSNSYSGSTQITNGTLQLGSSAALPTSSALTLGTGSTAGVLAFNGNTATLGSITFNGSGSQLSGTAFGGKLNLLASGTANATVTVNSGSHALHPDTTLQSNTVISLAANSFFSLHGVIDGSKSLTQIGSGTLAIYGANSYSGGTYLSGGYLSVQNTGALGIGTVTIDGNSILNLNNTILTNTVVFGSGSGAIINSGTLVNVTGTYAINSGTGTSITTNYSVQSGGNISFVSNLASTVYVQGTAQGTFSSDVLNAGTVIVNAGGRGVFSGGISGNVTTSGSSLFSGDVLGNVTVGGGTATFTAATGAASAINVNSGLGVITGTIGNTAHATAAGATLEIRGRVLSTADVNAEAGATVKLMGSQAFEGTTIDNDGSVIVDRTANLVLGALISGSGSLTKSDNLTLTLTGNNTYSGLTTISGGTLSVGNGGSSGALAGNVVNNAALVFNRSDDSIYAGNISGSGNLTKLGAGKLSLTGSGSYSGSTTVEGGILAVNGQIGGNAVVLAGGTLGGSGSVGGVLSGSGLVGPGNSPGILTASQFDPSAGLDAAFEFTALSPAYASATASLNDVLRLTNASNPFASASFTAGNVIDVYFNVDTIVSGQVYEGGFFTGLSAESLLAALDGKATFNYWAKTTGTADRTYGGSDYVSLSSLSGITGATFQTAPRTTNFGSGDVTGSVTQFVIIPEPDTIIFAGIGIAMAGWSLWKRRRHTP